ncbi:Barrel-sandwich domain of CusB or HlyD membrane-fusion [Pseudobutyrivibrio sp. UC1225]|uniref:efflux RND transporter periplasmic adaptor subunit n=1 Tax=Pseudobutyrivibrio sp. UC1225 TaxID=1798185 RepID=UPI0008E9E329|nr:efflux RND transporter periplasmic adaptor subunit [Pseudobutyrivibrio sp. UC1225]SFN88847.1 Barrel-sandwich domain of CusB or HlyD membrane-fusion [Pseudobutyrivibrio sp. UC1225]
METVKKIFGKIGRFLKKHVKLVIALVIVLGIVGYVRYSMAKAQKLMEEQANQPVTATVDQMDLTKSVSVTGTLTATDTAKVTSTIGGTMTGIKVKKINYEVGDYVEAGAVVVEFDGDDFDRKISELNAQYNIENKESAQGIEDLQKQITDDQEKIVDYQKWLDDKKMYYDNLKDAKEEYDKYPNDPDTVHRYQSETEICVQKHGFSEAGKTGIDAYEAKQDAIKDLQKEIDTLQTKIELAQLKQAFNQNYTQVDAKEDVYESKDATHVSAPISGYILTMNVTEGNNYAQGNTVFTIADTSEFVVEATVNEYNIANIEAGLPAKVKFEATEDETFDGEVTFVSLASEGVIGANQQSTGSNVASYKVKIKMKDNDKRMRVGMTAKASVIIDSAKNALCVPYDCIQKKDDGSFFVNVVEDDGKKKEIKVTKGLESDYYVEVKGEGLKKGMTVEAVVADGPSTDIMDYMYFD